MMIIVTLFHITRCVQTFLRMRRRFSRARSSRPRKLSGARAQDRCSKKIYLLILKSENVIDTKIYFDTCSNMLQTPRRCKFWNVPRPQRRTRLWSWRRVVSSSRGSGGPTRISFSSTRPADRWDFLWWKVKQMLFLMLQVRREGGKWEAGRLATDTLFILGSRANKALGFGQTRGRLYIKVG